MTRLLFGSGDIGGARALLPVINLAYQRGLAPLVMSNGPITSEGEQTWRWIDSSEIRFDGTISAYVFTGSTSDPAPLATARAASKAGIPAIFVLDSWSNYRERLQTDGQPVFVPDVYCVPDAVAEAEAQQENIHNIAVTGQPAFADAVKMAQGSHQRPAAPLKILFISEPVEADEGNRRGYTETGVIATIAQSLQSRAAHLHLNILPHPRDDAEQIERAWRQNKGVLTGTVLAKNSVRTLLDYDGIVGMASIMLYRAWLLGLPTLSYQPNLKLAALRQFGQRDGLVFVEHEANIGETIQEWMMSIQPHDAAMLRPEATLHQDAAAAILDIALKKAGSR